MNYINQRRIRILHVDDEAMDLKMTKLFLEKKGDADFEITSVLFTEDALAKLESGHFEVIISEYNMPGMDSIEFFFSGLEEPEIIENALDKGADRYISKAGNLTGQWNELARAMREVIKGGVDGSSNS